MRSMSSPLALRCRGELTDLSGMFGSAGVGNAGKSCSKSVSNGKSAKVTLSSSN